MSQEIKRFAVLGLAHPHVNYYFEELKHRSDFRLVAISDEGSRLRGTVAAEKGVPRYLDHRDLLAQHRVDVVGLAGIYSRRAEMVVDALDHGAQVIADKPLCTTLGQLADIETAVARTGGSVWVVLDKRHHPVTRAARQLLDAGVLGDLVLVASTAPHKLNRESRPPWYFERQMYGGILNDLGVHDIDLALTFSGTTSASVVAVAGNVSVPEHPGFEDHGAALLRLGPVTASIDVSWLTPQASPYHGDYRMCLTGTKGTAYMYWARNVLEVVSEEAALQRVALGPARRAAEDIFDAVSHRFAGEASSSTASYLPTASDFAATRAALFTQQSADQQGEQAIWAQASG